MAELLPAILTNDPKLLRDRVRQAETFAPSLHIDITDGLFASYRSTGPDDLIAACPRISWELHVMMAEPADWLETLLATRPTRMVIHPESTKRLVDILRRLAAARCEASLAFTSRTLRNVHWDQWTPYFPQLSQIVFVSVKPGFQGQTMIPSVVQAARVFTERFTAPRCSLDGGINHLTAARAKTSGAARYVIGSGIWHQRDPVRAYRDLCNMLQ